MILSNHARAQRLPRCSPESLRGLHSATLQKNFKHMKNRAFVLLVVLMAFVTFLKGQSNFVSGIVVTASGEKKEGQINYLEWGANPNQITFKSEETITKYGPADLQSFSVANGELYESYEVRLPAFPAKAHQIQLGDSIKKVKKLVFLRVEGKGVYNLLSFKESSDHIHFFIQEGKEQPIELVYDKIYDIYPGGRKVYRVDESYKRQLNYYFSQCDNFYNRIVATDYNRKDMKRLFSQYSACRGEPLVEYESKKENGDVYVYPIAGVSYSRVTVGGSRAPGWFENFDSPASIRPSIGIGVQLVVPRGRGRWSLNNELAVKFQEFTDEYSENPLGNIVNTYSSTLSMTYIRLNTLFRGKFLVSKFAPFAQVGISNSVALVYDTSVSQQQFDGGQLVDTDTFNFVDIGNLRKYELGLLASLGVEYNDQYGIELRFEQSSGFVNYTFRSTSVQSLYLLLNYKFGF